MTCSKCKKYNVMVYKPYYYYYEDKPYFEGVHMSPSRTEHFAPAFLEEIRPTKVMLIGLIIILIIYFTL